MTHILHRQLRGFLPLAVSGRSIRIVDANGKEHIDASGGAAVDAALASLPVAAHVTA